MKPRYSRIARASSTALVAICFSMPQLHAVDRFWNTGTGDWSEPTNWLGGIAPGLEDYAFIANGGTAQFTGAASTVPGVRIGRETIGNLEVSGGGTFTVTDSTHVGRRAGGVGSITISGAGTVYNNTGTRIIIGMGDNGGSASGVVTVNSGASLLLSSGLFIISDGFNAGTYSGTLNVDNGSVNSGSAEFWIGQDNGAGTSTGILNLSNNGSVTTGSWTAVGRLGATGTLNMSGGSFTKNGDGNFIVGDGNGSIGLVDQSAGDMNITSGQLWIGQAGGSDGTYDLKGGSITVNNWISVGRDNGKGVLKMSGSSTITKTGEGSVAIGTGLNGTGEIVQSGGVFNNTGSSTFLGEDAFDGGGVGLWSLSNTGQAHLGLLRIGTGGASQGTFNLDGGILSVTKIDSTSTGSTRAFNFNGGTLRASASDSAFMAGLSAANVMDGGAIIDSNNFNITIAQALVADGIGGLTKKGAGTLRLTGINIYSGNTLVEAGKLITNNRSIGAGNITVNDNAGFGIVSQDDFNQLMAGSVTLGSSGPTTLDFDLGSFFGNPSSAPLKTDSLAINGPVTINVADGSIEGGSIPLIEYSSKTGSSDSFTIGSLPPGVDIADPAFSDDGTLISLNVVVTVPRWNATENNLWDSTTVNWINVANFDPITYTDGKPVVFNDDVAGPTAGAVMLNQSVTPQVVTFENSSIPYTISGSGGINGSTGVVKKGNGEVTLSTINGYIGDTRIEGGTLSTGQLANDGIASGIGAGELVLAGGSFIYTGPDVATDRGYQVDGGGGIDIAGNLSLSGAITAASGGFSKGGPGTLTHTGGDTANQLAAGTYQITGGTVVMDGSAGNQINNVNGEVWIGQGEGNSGRLDLINGTTFSSNNYHVIGRQGGNGILNVENSTLVHTTVWDLMIGVNPGSVGVMNVSGTSVINNDWGWFLVGVAGGTGTYSQSGGSYTNAQPWSRLRVGVDPDSNGFFNLGGGTFAVGDIASVGVAGGTGTATLSGGTFTTGGRLYVGADGGSNGTLNITAGQHVSGNDTHIGVENARGEMTISGSGTLSSGGWCFVGGNFDGPADPQNSVGTANLADTSTWTVNDGRLTVGRRGGNQGFLNIAGGTLNKNGVEPLIVGDVGATGTVEHSAGAVNIPSGELWVGQGAGSTGNYNLGGGTLNVDNNWLAVGRENAVGFFTMTGGVLTKSGAGNLVVGTGGSATGTMEQTDGVVNILSGDTYLGQGGGSGSYNLSGSGVANFNVLHLGLDGSSNGTFNLGGTAQLNVEGITSGSTGNRTFNFNGGTLKPTGDNPSFMNLGSDSIASLGQGGANLDSSSFSVGISQNLSGPGGFAKKGAGTVELSGFNTYLGNTLVEDGTLTITAPNLSNGSTLTIGTVANSPAVLNLPNPGTDVVGALIIDGVPQPIGLYNKNNTSAITGDGVIEVQGTVVAGYESWAETNITQIDSEADASPGGDPDGDGQTNLAEFALDSNPLSGAASGKVKSRIANVGSVPSLVLTLPVRTGAVFAGTTEQVSQVVSGVIYRIQASDQLITWDLAVSEVTGLDKTAIESDMPSLNANGQWQYRTFRSPGTTTGDPEEFMRAVIVKP